MDAESVDAKHDLARIAKDLARAALRKEKDAQAKKKARRRELASLEKRIGKVAVSALRSCGQPINEAAVQKVRAAVENYLDLMPGGNKDVQED